MQRRHVVIAFFTVFAALPLFAYSISRDSGPTSGGFEVLVGGDFSRTGYSVVFGSTPATNVQRVDNETLRVTAPAHLPGRIRVMIYEGTRLLTNTLVFTYVGDVPSSLERVLLPIFVDPVRGLFGSEFASLFSAELEPDTDRVTLQGLRIACGANCPPDFMGDTQIVLTPQAPRLEDEQVVHSGTPGRFVFIATNELEHVAMNLRVVDRSRASQSYGTEIPVVRERDFTEGYAVVKLLHVPTDPLFRSTLRIYGTGPANVIVQVATPLLGPITRVLVLTPGANMFQPATATFTDFPVNVGPVTVTVFVQAPPAGTTTQPPPTPPRIWPFVSVTNNETQAITTITPHP
jgi:hypothetical protein